MVTIESINKKLGFDIRDPSTIPNTHYWSTECDNPELSPFSKLDEADYEFLFRYYGLVDDLEGQQDGNG